MTGFHCLFLSALAGDDHVAQQDGRIRRCDEGRIPAFLACLAEGQDVGRGVHSSEAAIQVVNLVVVGDHHAELTLARYSLVSEDSPWPVTPS